MNTPLKKIVYGGLLLSSTAFFLPTLFGSRGEHPEPPPERPATADAPEARPPAVTALQAGDSEGAEEVDELEAALAELEQEAPTASSGQTLIALWAARTGNELDGDAPSTTGEARSPEAAGHERLDAFVERHPLRGVLLSDTDSSALLEGLIVHVGEEPEDGIVVSEITRTGLVLECAGATREVTLPALRARPRKLAQVAAGDSLDLLEEMEAADAEPAE